VRQIATAIGDAASAGVAAIRYMEDLQAETELPTGAISSGVQSTDEADS
jgi:hypothetical protein